MYRFLDSENNLVISTGAGILSDQKTIDFIKELRGSFALIYVTDRHIVFAVDHFENKNLWFYHDQDTRTLTIASVPNIVTQKHGSAWKVLENKIYILDKKDYSINIQTNIVFTGINVQLGTKNKL